MTISHQNTTYSVNKGQKESLKQMFEKSAGRQFNFLTQMQLQTVKIVQADALSHSLPALAMVAPLVAGLTAMER